MVHIQDQIEHQKHIVEFYKKTIIKAFNKYPDLNTQYILSVNHFFVLDLQILNTLFLIKNNLNSISKSEINRQIIHHKKMIYSCKTEMEYHANKYGDYNKLDKIYNLTTSNAILKSLTKLLK